MRSCWIGIGSNIGDARAAFDDAWLRLSHHTRIELRTRSGIYLTRPVGVVAGSTFSNAVFSLKTSLSPIELLDVLQEIETEQGRTRGVRWGPRLIDLDLLFVDEVVLNEPRLTLPHPAAWYRRFVLDPLVEIEPALVHPLLNETVGMLQRHLMQRPLIVGGPERALLLGADVRSELEVRFPEIRFENQLEVPTTASVRIRVAPDEPQVAARDGVPIADLTSTPGDLRQRVIDFCTAVLDKPTRIGDW